MTLLRGVFLLAFALIAGASSVFAVSNVPLISPTTAERNTPEGSQEFYGTINKVNAVTVTINQIPFVFDVQRDIGPGRFSPGDYVFFRLNNDNKIVMIERTRRAADQAEITMELLHAAGFDPSHAIQPEKPAPPSNTPGKSAPIKHRDGVWRN